MLTSDARRYGIKLLATRHNLKQFLCYIPCDFSLKLRAKNIYGSENYVEVANGESTSIAQMNTRLIDHFIRIIFAILCTFWVYALKKNIYIYILSWLFSHISVRASIVTEIFDLIYRSAGSRRGTGASYNRNAADRCRFVNEVASCAHPVCIARQLLSRTAVTARARTSTSSSTFYEPHYHSHKHHRLPRTLPLLVSS